MGGVGGISDSAEFQRGGAVTENADWWSALAAFCFFIYPPRLNQYAAVNVFVLIIWKLEKKRMYKRWTDDKVQTPLGLSAVEESLWDLTREDRLYGRT